MEQIPESVVSESMKMLIPISSLTGDILFSVAEL